MEGDHAARVEFIANLWRQVLEEEGVVVYNDSAQLDGKLGEGNEERAAVGVGGGEIDDVFMGEGLTVELDGAHGERSEDEAVQEGGESADETPMEGGSVDSSGGPSGDSGNGRAVPVDGGHPFEDSVPDEELVRAAETIEDLRERYPTACREELELILLAETCEKVS